MHHGQAGGGIVGALPDLGGPAEHLGRAVQAGDGDALPAAIVQDIHGVAAAGEFDGGHIRHALPVLVKGQVVAAVGGEADDIRALGVDAQRVGQVERAGLREQLDGVAVPHIELIPAVGAAFAVVIGGGDHHVQRRAGVDSVDGDQAGVVLIVGHLLVGVVMDAGDLHAEALDDLADLLAHL